MENEIDFNEVATEEDAGLNADDFGKGNYLKNPEVGNEIIFTVLKVFENPTTTGKSKTGQEFRVGLRYKTGEYRRYDIETDIGTYTVNNWEIFFKLFGSTEGLLIKYSKEHNKSFAGAVISIKRLLDGSHMSTKLPDLMKILNVPLAEATAYQNTIKLAIKEQRLYEVKICPSETKN